MFDLWDSATDNVGIWAPSNCLVGRTRVSTYVCPSDVQDEMIDKIGGVCATPTGLIEWWSASIGAVTDSVNAWHTTAQVHTLDGDGIMFNLTSIPIRKVRDGTSKDVDRGRGDGRGSGVGARLVLTGLHLQDDCPRYQWPRYDSGRGRIPVRAEQWLRS